jgi:hypothetical protein
MVAAGEWAVPLVLPLQLGEAVGADVLKGPEVALEILDDDGAALILDSDEVAIVGKLAGEPDELPSGFEEPAQFSRQEFRLEIITVRYHRFAPKAPTGLLSGSVSTS